MSRKPLIGLLGALVTGLLAMTPATSSADDLARSLTVNGLRIHLGVMSVDAMREHPESYSGHHSVQHLPTGKNMYHVLVTLFDSASGKRVTDAHVEARVSPLGLAGVEQTLHPTHSHGGMCYCNYFTISPGDIYVIQLQIHRPEMTKVSRAKFTYWPERR